ncbi:MAG TPA: hypothetical protein VJR92_01000 [Gemmatimonadaceae bacterium]|nr:hypothetical protein [Gemmatimonadaceae bacterium]
MRLSRPTYALAALALFAAPALAQDHQHGTDELGNVTFPVTCNVEAQKRMSTAIAMLHSFWFPEARKTFESVVAADPKCGIAYWGVAMTHFGNPIAGGTTAQGQADGWAAIQKGVAAGAGSDRDRAYIDAGVALFRDHATANNRTRMAAYEVALKSIVDRFPDDTEAKIFHAVMMVANAPPTDLTFAQQKKAAETLTALVKLQPKHPGLVHYIIHAFDSPPLANLALDAARQYANLAPAAPHALHMPSHTFTRLGLWDESIKTNRRSADLEPTAGAKAHPMDYMVYAYLQQGRDDAASAVLAELRASTPGEYVWVGALGSYNAVAMPARYAMERDDWKAASEIPVSNGPPSVAAVARFARGLGAARLGNAAAARVEVAEIEKLIAASKAQNDSYWAVVATAQKTAIDAWIAHAEGRHQDAVRLAREAADTEEQVEKHAVTPGPLIPARELLGDILMVHRQPAEALVAYETTFKREPNRLRTLVGAARAAKAASNNASASKYYGEVVKLADPKSTRADVAEARTFVAQR